MKTGFVMSRGYVFCSPSCVCPSCRFYDGTYIGYPRFKRLRMFGDLQDHIPPPVEFRRPALVGA